VIFGPPTPRVAHSFFKSPPRLDGRTDSVAFAIDDLAVLHTFASMAGPNPGSIFSCANQYVGKLCAARGLRVSAISRRPRASSRDWLKGEVSMEFQDKILKCIDCGADFVFTAGEQLFFHDKQFKNEPKRCKACKTKRVSVLGATPHPPGQSFAKVETRTVCSQCGKETTVPFRPTQGRPVFCRECFQQRRQAATA
jgi:CxxC-x17-CxxC domain-containing protein